MFITFFNGKVIDVLKVFNKYVNSFDISDEMVMSKIEHSIRVYENMKEYAKKLGYNKEEIIIASEIGLLHDIGRFKQIKEAHSFDDFSTFDHAEEGVIQLFDEGAIADYKIDEAHYETIKYAIKYHNKLELKNNPDRQIMKFAKLIRDVDKIDILYLLGVLGIYNHKSDDSEISEEVLEYIRNHKCVDKRDVKTHNDDIAVKFALAFDINNDMCIKEFRKNLDAYYKRIEKDNKFKEIYDITIKYLDERMK